MTDAAIRSEPSTPRLVVETREGWTVLAPSGDWLSTSVGPFDAQLRRLAAEVDPGRVAIDLEGLGRIDVGGAYALGRVLDRCGAPEADFHFHGTHPTARRLIAFARENMAPCPPPKDQGPGLVLLLDRTGRGLVRGYGDFVSLFAFFGQMLVAVGRALLDPRRIRLAPVFHIMETAGLDALPIVCTLSFFIGAVVAYLGANVLQDFGAAVFAVELVALSVLREFAVVITAILLAGRSDSAFTAQIGAMKMQQEVDAIRVLGVDPFDALVVPRVLACVLMTPLLTFAAMATGILGGMVSLWAALDISPGFFLSRMSSAIDIQHFWAGMAKAPVFALVIAVIGCRHGLAVGGDVESLGRHVTAAVVQSIFAVIVIDAAFALAYFELGI